MELSRGFRNPWTSLAAQPCRAKKLGPSRGPNFERSDLLFRHINQQTLSHDDGFIGSAIKVSEKAATRFDVRQIEGNLFQVTAWLFTESAAFL